MCVNAIQMDGGSEFSAEFEQACQEGHRASTSVWPRPAR